MARVKKKETAENLKDRFKQWSGWIRANVPPGVRAPFGLLLIVGGVFGFLPVLGFWMIPLGVAVLAMDIAPLFRAMLKHRSDPEASPPEKRSKSGSDGDRS